MFAELSDLALSALKSISIDYYIYLHIVHCITIPHACITILVLLLTFIFIVKKK